LPQVTVSPNYDVSSWKISSRQSVQFIHQPTLLGAFFLKHHGMVTQYYLFSCHLLNLLKVIYHNLHVILEHCNLFFDLILSIFQNFHAL